MVFMKVRICMALFLVIGLQAFSQTGNGHGRVVVSPNGHYLQYEDGTPFFWLGDTGWELFHRLNLKEVEQYLDNRSSKGFNVIQAVLLAEFNGLRIPNQNGDVPFQDLDPTKPNENYFKFVDTVVQRAAAKNLFMGLLPTWGDKVTPAWGEGPVVFDSVNAYTYGLWLGRRYAGAQNVVWILGGDRPPVRDTQDWRPIWRQMARGILEGTNNLAFITYHTWGGRTTTSASIHNEPWLHMNMMQSGHGGGHDVPVWEWIKHDFGLQPAKPTLDAEPNYEDHPVNPWPKWDPANGYFRDHDVRKQTYRSVFAGANGVTYGHHSVWQFWNSREEKINYADRYWTEALDRPGAFQVGYLKKLVLSRPSLTRVPDSTLIAAGQGRAGAHMEAFRDSANTYAMIYLPQGKKIAVNMGFLNSARVQPWWFNPRNGSVKKMAVKKRAPVMSFTPPTLGKENDWVLVLDDPAAAYPAPGTGK
jgi:hypothetical protein